MAGFFLNASGLHSSYNCHNQEDDAGVIDLGLSLKTLHSQVYHPSTQYVVQEEYTQMPEWTHLKPELTSSNASPYPSTQTNATQQCDEEVEGVQSKERWAYVKVNMDGVVVGRKICILDHADYSSLAIQLEDMFGRQRGRGSLTYKKNIYDLLLLKCRLCISGLRLFQAESGFSLFYKDNRGNWRPVGDVPWRDFVDCVKRLRIVRKNGTPDLIWP